MIGTKKSQPRLSVVDISHFLEEKVSRHTTLILITLVLALLALKVGNSSLLTGSLWGEDGNIFLTQALEEGVTSIWLPYNGYLHLYPRLIAFASSALPLSIIPTLYNLGWLLGVLVATFAIRHYGRKQSLSELACLSLIACTLLQPNNGEVFFTLTNAQWFIAVALALYVCHPDTSRPGWTINLALLLATLTGPFALIAAPVLLMQTALHRKKIKALSSYLIVFGGSAIQLYYLSISDRMAGAPAMDPDIHHWLMALWTFLTFGLKSNLGVACALIAWTTFGAMLSVQLVRGNNAERFLHFSLFALAGMFFIAGLMTQKHQPHLPSPLGICSRYYVIPYTLLIFSAGVALRRHAVLGLAALATFAMVCALSLTRVDRGEQHWVAYSLLANKVSPLYIPIAPSMAAYPGWSVHIQNPLPPTESASISLNQVGIYNADRQEENGNLTLTTATSDPYIRFELSQCQDQRFIGVLINAWRQEAGFAQLFWGNQFNFQEQQSIRRFYPAGDVHMQFAFKRRAKDDTLRLDPSESPEKIVVRNIQLVCLGGIAN